MNSLSELAYAIDPARWVENIIGITPAAWQAQFLAAP